MFSKSGARVVAAVIAISMLAGCAELDRRGGTIAQIQDNVLFVARTKSHRLFRSYLLIGVLVAAARQGAHNQADAAAIEGNLGSALSIAFEAYDCLYGNAKKADAVATAWVMKATTPGKVGEIGSVKAIDFEEPAICQFFDEKMARLDYALYRLALSTLINPESSAHLVEIRDKLVGRIPVLSASAKAAIYANQAVGQASNIVDDLLNLSFSSAGPALTLLPLYRDSLEINMWVIVDTLTRRGGRKGSACPWPSATVLVDEKTAVQSFEYGFDCRTRDRAFIILNNGNGDLREWRAFVWNMNFVAYGVEAYAPHFALVTRLIWRSCRNLLMGDNCKNLMNKAAKTAVEEAFLVEMTKKDRPPYSVSIAPATRFARQPVRNPGYITTAPAMKPAPVQSGDDRQKQTGSDATGSIAPATSGNPAAR